MNAAHARQLLSVAEHGSFSKAARALGLSQATVSTTVAAVEADLGLTLFLRTTRSVSTTAAFAALKGSLARLVAAQVRVERLAATLSKGTQKTLRVGISPVVDAGIVDPLLADFERAFSTRIELVELNLHDLEHALVRGTVELAIAPLGASRRFRTFVLYTEDLLVVGRPTGVGPVAISELAREPIVMMPDACGLARTTLRYFREAGVRLQRAPTLALGYQLLERAALRGRGHAILPRSKIAQATASRPLLRSNGSPAMLEVRVLQRRNQTDPTTRQLLRSLSEGKAQQPVPRPRVGLPTQAGDSAAAASTRGVSRSG